MVSKVVMSRLQNLVMDTCSWPLYTLILTFAKSNSLKLTGCFASGLLQMSFLFFPSFPTKPTTHSSKQFLHGACE